MDQPEYRNNLGQELAIVSRRYRSCADRYLAPLGLTQAKWVPLAHLWLAGGKLPHGDLVARVGVEGPSLVRVLDELEQLGLVERSGGEPDRRTKIIRLTEKAGPVVAEFTQVSDRIEGIVYNGISKSDFAAFRKVLNQISQNLANFRA
jgi:MarR family transcriptional regulator for hemolysin